MSAKTRLWGWTKTEVSRHAICCFWCLEYQCHSWPSSKPRTQAVTQAVTSQLCCSVAQLPCARYFTAHTLSLPICQMGMIEVPPHGHCCADHLRQCKTVCLSRCSVHSKHSVNGDAHEDSYDQDVSFSLFKIGTEITCMGWRKHSSVHLMVPLSIHPGLAKSLTVCQGPPEGIRVSEMIQTRAYWQGLVA